MEQYHVSTSPKNILLTKHTKNISLRDIFKIFCPTVFVRLKKVEVDKNVLFL